jgi:hypothetical protein
MRKAHSFCNHYGSSAWLKSILRDPQPNLRGRILNPDRTVRLQRLSRFLPQTSIHLPQTIAGMHVAGFEHAMLQNNRVIGLLFEVRRLRFHPKLKVGSSAASRKADWGKR